MKTYQELMEELITEKAPPDPKIEKWIRRVKPIFKKEYGEDWAKYLYGKAWTMYDKKRSKK
jgi:hypothetical protein